MLLYHCWALPSLNLRPFKFVAPETVNVIRADQIAAMAALFDLQIKCLGCHMRSVSPVHFFHIGRLQTSQLSQNPDLLGGLCEIPCDPGTWCPFLTIQGRMQVLDDAALHFCQQIRTLNNLNFCSFHILALAPSCGHPVLNFSSN